MEGRHCPCHPFNDNIQVTFDCNAGVVVITGTGLADHPMGPFDGSTGCFNPNTPSDQNDLWRIPLHPVVGNSSGVDYLNQMEKVQNAVVLELSNNAQSRPVRGINLMQRSVDLPAGAAETSYDRATLSESVDLLGITLRAMGVCTEIQVSADLPEEGVVRLLDLPDHAPHWRMMYQLDSLLFHVASGIVRSTSTGDHT